MFQNAQSIQDKLENTKERLLAEKIILHDRLEEYHNDIQHIRKKKKALSQIIKNMKIELNVKKITEQQLQSRLQYLESTLKRSIQSYKNEMFQRKHFQDERSLLLQQINDAEKQKEAFL